MASVSQEQVVSVVALLLVCCNAAVPCPMLNTTCGPVRGFEDQGLCAYLGVPYAVTARWQIPVVSSHSRGSCWAESVLDASSYGPVCPQRGKGQQWFNTTQSERCTTLNIWVSRDTLLTRNRPVFVFIHGGSSLVGSAANPLNHPGLLARAGFVAVNFNYREGALGYLQLDLYGKKRIGGMFGLQDSIAALRWVQENGHAIGGDTNRVTVWGQSTGGTMVQALLLSPSAAGLFSAAISLSGSPRMNETVVRGANVLIDRANCSASAGVPPTRLEACLMALPPDAIIDAEPLNIAPWWDPWGGAGVPMDFCDLPSYEEARQPPASLIVADGTVMPLSPDEAFNQTRIPLNDVPLIIGNMAQEIDFDPKERVHNLTSAQYAAFIAHKFARFASVDPADIMRLYPLDEFIDAQMAYETMAADLRVTCGILDFARNAAAAFSSPVYHFINMHRLSDPFALFALYGNDWVQRFSSHQLDQLLLLKTYNNPVSKHHYEPSSDDDAVSDLLLRAFASLGERGALDPSLWPAVNNGSRHADIFLSLAISARPEVVQEPRKDRCRFWAQHGFGRLSWNN